jgi:hypothetical protein
VFAAFGLLVGIAVFLAELAAAYLPSMLLRG